MHVDDMIPNTMELQEENQQLRRMIDSLKEDLRDQLAIHCPITMDFFIQAHYKELEHLPSHEVMNKYCRMRYHYADAMIKARQP